MLQVSPGSTVLLRGHVDNSKVEEFRKTGGEAYVRTMALRSVELSKNRAAEIKRLLVEQYGVDPDRVDIVGRGWEEPVARTRNRIAAWKCNGSCWNDAMTINDLIQLANGHLLALLIFFVVPPVIAWLCGLVHGRGNGGNAPWKYIYSVLVYLVCIPGLFASVLTGYQLFFSAGRFAERESRGLFPADRFDDRDADFHSQDGELRKCAGVRSHFGTDGDDWLQFCDRAGDRQDAHLAFVPRVDCDAVCAGGGRFCTDQMGQLHVVPAAR